MKLFLCCLFALSLSAPSAFAAACNGAAVMVTVNHEVDPRLVSLLMSLNSIPLDVGAPKQVGEESQFLVSVPADYAKANGITSFVIAQKIEQIRAGDAGGYGIVKIDASACYDAVPSVE